MPFLHLKQALVLLCLSTTLGGSAAPTADALAAVPVNEPLSAQAQHAPASLAKRQATICQNTSGHLISEINSSGCVGLLRDLGVPICNVSGTEVVMFMEVGDAAIYGINASGTGTVSASRDDVADAAQNIIDACTNQETGLLQGRAQVNGNPNFVVMIDSSSLPACDNCF